MQFNVVYLETHPYITLWLFDLHPPFFEHYTKIFFLLRAIVSLYHVKLD